MKCAVGADASAGGVQRGEGVCAGAHGEGCRDGGLVPSVPDARRSENAVITVLAAAEGDARCRRRGGEPGRVGATARPFVCDAIAITDRDRRGGHDQRGADQSCAATGEGDVRGVPSELVRIASRGAVARDRRSRADRFVGLLGSAARTSSAVGLSSRRVGRRRRYCPARGQHRQPRPSCLRLRCEQRPPAHPEQPAHGCDDLRGRARTRRGGRGRRDSGRVAEARSAPARSPRGASRGQRALRSVGALAGRSRERCGGP